MLKLDEPFRDKETFIIFHFKSSDLGSESIFFSFWLIFCRLDPDPGRILRIQQIRILSIVCDPSLLMTHSLTFNFPEHVLCERAVSPSLSCKFIFRSDISSRISKTWINRFFKRIVKMSSNLHLKRGMPDKYQCHFI